MSTKTDIANLALSRIGVSIAITDVDTDTSTEAETILTAYATDRDFVLRDFAWPFAKAYTSPTLAYGTAAEPYNDDWTYAYRYPADCLSVRRIVTSAGRRETVRRQFELGRDPAFATAAAWSALTAYVDEDIVTKDGVVYQCILAHTNHAPPNATYWVVVAGARLIFTDEEDAQIEYTVAVTDEAEFDPLFVSMFAFRLAASIAPALSRMTNIVATCLQLYEFEKSKAQSRALNESQPQTPQDAEWIRARTGIGGTTGQDWEAFPSGFEVR